MITFILFAVLDDHEDDSVASGGKVMSYFNPDMFSSIVISDVQHLVTTAIVFVFTHK